MLACSPSEEISVEEPVADVVIDERDGGEVTRASADSGRGEASETRPPFEDITLEQSSDDAQAGYEGEAWIAPNLSSPLALWVHVDLDRAASVQVTVWHAGAVVWRSPWSPSAASQRVSVLGLPPGVEVALEVALRGETGEGTLWRTLTHTSGQLAATLPLITVSTAAPESVAPGLTFFGLRTRDEVQDPAWPLYMAVNQSGVPVWSYRDEALSLDGMARDLRLLDSGDVMILAGDGVRIVTSAGELVHEWREEGLLPEPFHHDALIMPSGNLLMLGREVRDVSVAALGGVQSLRGDTISEYTPSGDKVWGWSAFEHLNTERFPGPLSQTPNQQSGFLNWTHANALVYDPEGDSIWVSLRHQNQVIRISRATGTLLETVGVGGDYSLDSGDWFYSQHSPEFEGGGGLLIYDNGNERPEPEGGALLPKTERYSRAVSYTLDGDTGVAHELWSYEVPEFTGFLGGVERLSNGNVLVCAGGLRGAQSSRLARLHEVTSETPATLVWSLEVEAYIYRARRATWERFTPQARGRE